MDWKKITNIDRKEKENIFNVIIIFLLLGIGIEIFLSEKVGIGQVGATLIIGIVAAFASTKNNSTTIKQSSKNTFYQYHNNCPKGIYDRTP